VLQVDGGCLRDQYSPAIGRGDGAFQEWTVCKESHESGCGVLYEGHRCIEEIKHLLVDVQTSQFLESSRIPDPFSSSDRAIRISVPEVFVIVGEQ